MSLRSDHKVYFVMKLSNKKIMSKYLQIGLLNPLCPCVTNSSRIAKISILK